MNPTASNTVVKIRLLWSVVIKVTRYYKANQTITILILQMYLKFSNYQLKIKFELKTLLIDSEIILLRLY